MSVWTHVNAQFRVDALRGIGADPSFDWVDKTFGRTIPDIEYVPREERDEAYELDFAEMMAAWDDYRYDSSKFVPVGSEGSLQISVWENPDNSCLAAYTVSVFGSLRDYDDADAVVEWFGRCCESAPIRQAVLQVEVEMRRSVVAVWGGNGVVLMPSPGLASLEFNVHTGGAKCSGCGGDLVASAKYCNHCGRFFNGMKSMKSKQ